MRSKLTQIAGLTSMLTVGFSDPADPDVTLRVPASAPREFVELNPPIADPISEGTYVCTLIRVDDSEPSRAYRVADAQESRCSRRNAEVMTFTGVFWSYPETDALADQQASSRIVIELPIQQIADFYCNTRTSLNQTADVAIEFHRGVPAAVTQVRSLWR